MVVTKFIAIMNKDDKIFVAGSTGMVGSAIVRLLLDKGFTDIIGSINRRKPRDTKGVSYVKINLLDYNDVAAFFEREKPDYVFDAAAKVGGIVANSIYRGQFLFENLQIQNNIIHNAYLHKVKKLLFLGSSCIYPKDAPQPIKEEYLLTGILEDTNEPYAIAKIAGLKMCESYNRQYKTNFIAAMPTNLYGTADSYDPQNSHVFPALIRKFHEAKESGAPNVTIWGTGAPMREFMHVDDLAAALFHLMENYEGNEFFNIGWGKDISIKDLALLIKDVIGYEGELVFDTSKPDGTFRKLLDVTRLTELGFTPSIGIREGIADSYKDFMENYT